LVKYAAATEDLIDAYSPSEGDGGVKGVDAGASIDATTLPGASMKALCPGEVLATVSSGPANAQIKTLMRTYNVNAMKAQLILNTAMAGLESEAWKDAGKTMDTLMRQATLVKESAKLSFTIVGIAATAGGVSGALGVGSAVKAIISDGVKRPAPQAT
jgi:hypothetical protein